MRALGLWLLATAPALAQATPYDGLWTAGNPLACVEGRDSPDFAVRIEAGVFTGLESSCEMTHPVAVRDMGATLYDMVCVGEGAEWTYRALFATALTGALIQLADGEVIVRQRCRTAP